MALRAEHWIWPSQDPYIAEDVQGVSNEVKYDYGQGATGRIMGKIDGYPMPWNIPVRQGSITFL